MKITVNNVENEKIESFQYVQLELFPKTEIEQLREELSKVKKELGNVRRGIFSRHNEILKLIVELRSDLDTIKCQLNCDANLSQEA